MSGERGCEADRVFPAWYDDKPDTPASCSQCGERAYHDGEAWRHVTR